MEVLAEAADFPAAAQAGVGKMFTLNDTDRKSLEGIVAKAEENTSGEIVPAIMNSSDLYPVAHFRAALIGGILGSILCYYFYNFEDPIALIWAQIPGMIIFYLLAYIPFIKRNLISKSQMDEEVYQRALEVYHERSVSLTRDRTGILIYISILERQVHILADTGISSKVSSDFWQEIVNEMISDIKKDQIVKAMSSAITSCGNKLSEHFPPRADDTDEIKNSITTS